MTAAPAPSAPRLSVARLITLLALSALPVLLTTVIMMWIGNAIGPESGRDWMRPQYVAHLVYAAANWCAIGAVLLVARRPLRQLGLKLSLTRQRMLLALTGLAIGIAVFGVVDWLLRLAELPTIASMRFTDARPIEVFALWLGPVVTAPLAEEILFRVVWIGALATRIPIHAAVICSIVAFAAIHYPYFGLGGVIFISAWALVPTALFLRTGDLTTPLTMHVMNNIFAYLIVPFFIPQIQGG